MKRSLIALAIAVPLVAIGSPAIGSNPPAWDKTIYRDGSVALRGGAVLPRNALLPRVQYVITRGGDGRAHVAIKITYCTKGAACDPAVRRNRR